MFSREKKESFIVHFPCHIWRVSTHTYTRKGRLWCCCSYSRSCCSCCCCYYCYYFFFLFSTGGEEPSSSFSSFLFFLSFFLSLSLLFSPLLTLFYIYIYVFSEKRPLRGKEKGASLLFHLREREKKAQLSVFAVVVCRHPVVFLIIPFIIAQVWVTIEPNGTWQLLYILYSRK